MLSVEAQAGRVRRAVSLDIPAQRQTTTTANACLVAAVQPQRPVLLRQPLRGLEAAVPLEALVLVASRMLVSM
jgi:hypothetical protein